MTNGMSRVALIGAMLRTRARPAARCLPPGLLLLVLAGCGPLARKAAVPDDLVDRAVVLGMPAIRTWSDELNPEFLDELLRAGKVEVEKLRAAGHADRLPPAEFLAISGGGANGAYGAGLLCGWTTTKSRPTFKLVTGISTGALSAPFAFLGSEYDDDLRSAYTGVTTKDILKPRSLLAGLFSDAMADNTPLRAMVKRLVSHEVMGAIAAAYREGRLLLIGTTDLDAQRGVVWNMGAIAASGHPRAPTLFHDILVASAAIPGAFPPVMLDVEVNGHAYQEMHVDGGAVSQVFVYPPSFELSSLNVKRDRRVYVIRNGRLDPQWAQVQRRTLNIATRAIDSLIQTQGFGDLYRIYLTSLRDQVDFSLAYIPSTFKEKPKEAFDPVYMKKLFELGEQNALAGTAWVKTPPGYATTTGTD
jgi:predicted acylesterase/phospholipase RssA